MNQEQRNQDHKILLRGALLTLESNEQEKE